MEQFITRITTNLNGTLQMTQLYNGLMMTGDDKANRILVDLTRDGMPVPITDAYRIQGFIIRGDGYTLDIPGTITEEGWACVDIPALAYIVSGTLSIAIRMVSNENKIVIATASCYINPTETDAIIDTAHRIPDVEELLQHIADVDAELEQARESNEVWAAAEAERVSNETARMASETTRQTAEVTRESNEAARQTAEVTRESNEVARQTAEATREGSETARDLAEAARGNAETARQTAETTRNSAEATRVSNETTRQTQETTRQSQETAREQAQAARNKMIDDMEVAAIGLDAYADPTATISVVNGHKKIVFGLRPGDPFVIQKTFASISAMNSYTGTDIRVGQFAIITSNENDPDNAKLYVKTSSGFSFVTDLSGAQGIQGPRGYTGNGISSASIGSDYKLKLNFTDGTSYTSDSIRGATGNGISSAEVTSDYKLKITMTDGTTYTSGSIRGPRGEDGGGSVALSYDSSKSKLLVQFNG